MLSATGLYINSHVNLCNYCYVYHSQVCLRAHICSRVLYVAFSSSKQQPLPFVQLDFILIIYDIYSFI